MLVLVSGNPLRLEIPMVGGRIASVDGSAYADRCRYAPSPDYPITACLYSGPDVYKRPVLLDGSKMVIEDDGALPVGTYTLKVYYHDSDGHPLCLTPSLVFGVADYTEDASFSAPAGSHVTHRYITAE